NSNEHIRPIKFMLVRFSNIMGMSFGTFIGGHLMTTTQHPDPQLRTYYRNFVLSIGLDIVIIVQLFAIFYLASKPTKSESTNSEYEELSTISQSTTTNN